MGEVEEFVKVKLLKYFRLEIICFMYKVVVLFIDGRLVEVRMGEKKC